MTRVHIFVSGRVQGVLYRRFAQKEAKKLGITGWARNLIDGRVEMVCEGTEENIRAFLKWAGKGPFFARVSAMKTQEEAYQGAFASFEVREFGF